MRFHYAVWGPEGTVKRALVDSLVDKGFRVLTKPEKDAKVAKHIVIVAPISEFEDGEAYCRLLKEQLEEARIVIKIRYGDFLTKEGVARINLLLDIAMEPAEDIIQLPEQSEVVRWYKKEFEAIL